MAVMYIKYITETRRNCVLKLFTEAESKRDMVRLENRIIPFYFIVF